MIGISAFKNMRVKEKRNALHAVGDVTTKLAKKAYNGLKIKRRNHIIYLNRQANKNRYIQRGKSLLPQHHEEQQSESDG